MKLGKFKDIIAQNNWLVIYLTSRCGIPPYKRSTPQGIAEFKEYVRKGIDYIAFPPWESLDLSAHSSGLEQIPGSDQKVRKVEYDVLWYSNQSPRFSQRMYIHHRLPDPSVEQLISGIVDHHLDRLTTVRYIGVDAVIRRTVQDSGTERWEIFLCPEGWMLESLKKDRPLLHRLREKGLQVQGLAVFQ